MDIPLYQSANAQLETDYYAHNEALQLFRELVADFRDPNFVWQLVALAACIGAGWLITGWLSTVTVRLPAATAQASSVTLVLATMTPVRELSTTRAAGAAVVTSISSSWAMKAIRSSTLPGLRTRIVRLSIAVAIGSPRFALIAAVTIRAVPKSASRNSKWT